MNLSRYGGASGLRDLGLLESALNRPRWSHEFDREADLHQLAAAYNGRHVVASQADAVRTMLALASGELSEDQMAGWLRENAEAASVRVADLPLSLTFAR